MATGLKRDSGASTGKSLRVLSFVNDGRVASRLELVDAIRAGIAQGVDVVASQGNGMDPGPYYLGSGETGGPPRKAVYEAAIMGAKEAKIPFILSLGGRAGADAQLESYLTVIDEMAREKGVRFRAAVISGQIDKDYLRAKLADGVKIPRLFDTPRLSEYLTEADLDDATVIQAQMGAEAVMAALKLYDEGKIDGILTGRALDTGLYMAYPLSRGFPVAASAHLAKIIECGTMCCDPAEPFNAVIGEIHEDGELRVWPIDDAYRCTVKSVAGHALYERENPTEEKTPRGTLDISEATYEQLDEKTVRVQGATWQETPYTVKLEGVKSLGYETAFLLAANDPAMLHAMDEGYVDRIVGAVSEHVTRTGEAAAGTFKIVAHVLGAGALPSGRDFVAPAASEIVILIRVVAPTQKASQYIANQVRNRLKMSDYAGRTSTAGNYADPLPNVYLDQGQAYVFNVWHLLPLTDPTEPFQPRIVEFPRS
jgi:hypothetical protein